MAARFIGATNLADRLAQCHPDRPWGVSWARWRVSPHFVAGRHTSDVWGVAVGELDGRPVAVSAGKDGTVRVWDLASSIPVDSR
jgi:WD40 repeat protein